MRVNLSTSNSNRRAILIKVISFIAVFFIFEHLIGDVLLIIHNKNLSHGYFSKLKWDDFYKEKDNSVDLFFIGSSHAMESFDPAIFDKNLNVNSVNLSNSAQKPDSGYYVLKEAFEHQKPKVVVYEVYWAVMGNDYYLRQVLDNYEFIKDPEVKKELFNASFSPIDKVLYNFKSYWYRDDIQTYFSLLTGGSAKNDIRYYKDKGYVYDKTVVDKNVIMDEVNKNLQVQTASKPSGSSAKASKPGIFTELFNGISGTVSTLSVGSSTGTINQFEYLEKGIQLCQQNGAQVILVTAPLPPTYMNYLNTVGNYANTHNYVESIAKKYNVPYVDYNYLNKDGSMFKDSNFRDASHLNNSGAQILDNNLSQYLIENHYFNK